ncbi:MAG: enoyl-CoA hydratase [Hyphomicrobiaceae bacterium]
MTTAKTAARAGSSAPAQGEAGAPPILITRSGSTLIARLNRPGSRNALSQVMLAALQTVIDEAGADKTVRAIVIAAAGPVFSAGHDLKEITGHRADADGGKAFTTLLVAQCSHVMRSIMRCPKPVIAAVEGTATAAGCQLVATCDLAVAADTARFSTPGVNIGLFCSTPMVALTRNVSRKHAMEMLMLGEFIDAAHAAEFGLVNRVVPAERVLEEALALAQTIASKSGAIVKIGKETFYRQIDMTVDAAYDYTSQVLVENMLHRDAAEGIGAFIEKRDPKWSE